MNKQEFLAKLDAKIKQEHLTSGAKVHSYLFANEDIADFALRLLLAALDVNARQVIQLAISDGAEFTNKASALETVMTIKNLKTHAERGEQVNQIINQSIENKV